MPVPPHPGAGEATVAGGPVAAEPVERPAQRRRVLVIDHDEPLLEVVQEVLRASGYEVETARHGFLAGYLVGHFRPDAIVLDITMPGLDGFEVLSLMRRRPDARTIPVVACTSLKGLEIEARIELAGFDGHLRKPIDLRSLVKLLEELIPGRESAPGSP